MKTKESSFSPKEEKMVKKSHRCGEQYTKMAGRILPRELGDRRGH
jgi:hypothetical protein